MCSPVWKTHSPAMLLPSAPNPVPLKTDPSARYRTESGDGMSAVKGGNADEGISLGIEEGLDCSRLLGLRVLFLFARGDAREKKKRGRVYAAKIFRENFATRDAIPIFDYQAPIQGPSLKFRTRSRRKSGTRLKRGTGANVSTNRHH